MNTAHPKRLIEVDLPIRRISDHARGEKSIRQGHISALHIWWARRPLASCRAVTCAALWPDPADPHCPQAFRARASAEMLKWTSHARQSLLSEVSRARFEKARQKPALLKDATQLRGALLDFIADFADWDSSTRKEFLETARALTQAAHEALGGAPGTKPVIVDPFAGGGAFPLEATRVGGQAYAGDLNALAATLNQFILEYCPKLKDTLVTAVDKWGRTYLDSLRKRLTQLYPEEKDGASVICYFWARTIKCEGPGCGVNVPIIRHFKFAQRPGNEAAVEVYYTGRKLNSRIHLGSKAKQHDGGTSRRSSVTCPKCGFTTQRKNVETQAKTAGFGYHLFAICSRGPSGSKKTYREPHERDFRTISLATDFLHSINSRKLAANVTLIPDEELPYLRSIFNVRVYGIDKWSKLYNNRQLASAIHHVLALRDLAQTINSTEKDKTLAEAVIKCLALVVSNGFQYQCNIATYLSDGICSAFIQGQSLGMKMDFVEANPLVPDLVGGFDYALAKTLSALQVPSLIRVLAGRVPLPIRSPPIPSGRRKQPPRHRPAILRRYPLRRLL